MERVSDYIIRSLVENGINNIFFITGRGILYLTDALAKNKEMGCVPVYHEQGASYAAMAYAAARDGMSACLLSTGCAATNAVTACLCAYQDNLPIIFISGQHMLNETTRYTNTPIRTFGSQEADIIGIVENITKYSVMLTNAVDVAYEMDKAFYIANEGRKGPVWIDIPLDIQDARIDVDCLQRYEKPYGGMDASAEDIAYVASILENAKRPILFIGGGVRSADAILEIQSLSMKYNLPAVFSISAADVYGSGHVLSIGAVGSLGGSRAGNFALQNADAVLVMGSKLCSQTTGAKEQFARDAKVVVVDIDENEHMKKGVHIDGIIHADVKCFLNQLLLHELKISCDAWIEKCLHWKDVFAIKNEKFIKELDENNKLDLYNFADTLSEQLEEDATVITDAGFEELIIPSTIRFHGNQRCLFPAAQGAMGYAIPAIIGAHFAGKHNIIAVIGDGSFMMNMQELQIIKVYQIPVKIFVINNNMYAVIRKRQKDLFRNRTIGNDPSDGVPAPDFAGIAKCFGFEYMEIMGTNDLTDGIDRALKYYNPLICEVHTVEDQTYFHMSFAFNESRKLVRRPLEDLSPYIDRSLINSEMIIEPFEF